MTALSAGAVVQRRGDLLANDLSVTETVMLDVEGSSYYGIKDVGRVIWDHLESPIRVDALCERLLTPVRASTRKRAGRRRLRFSRPSTSEA